MDLTIKRTPFLRGEFSPPGDKSISHRAAIFAALADGTSEISNFLEAGDCLSTLRCLQALGVEIEGPREGKLKIRAQGPEGLKEPEDVLDAGNSGTTMRFLLGVLAAQPFYSVITGDHSLRRRPMARVAEPLRQMGAHIWGREGGNLAPLSIKGGNLRPIEYNLPVASAQVKSALLLAGLHTEGETVVREPVPARDHTERMLEYCGVKIKKEDLEITIYGRQRIQPFKICIPGDFSAAAFFLVAACIHPRAEVVVRNVGLNPTRTGLLTVLQEMGAELEVIQEGVSAGEPYGVVRARSSSLKGTKIGGALIPRLIDEIPVLAVAAAVAQGSTVIRDAAELKVKESDRITTLAVELRKMGAKIETLPDGMVLEGGSLKGAVVDSHGDHRLAMALAVAGLIAEGETVIRGAECMSISYPGFLADLEALTK
ncbi:3-phosphoshikimate 1-carboxyvinyltransferase [Thermanaeromonas toyohensis ToBE]|uniref:3-phosphoshikimate 1-carboxyvinyltransferase n=1 Tax=Thermanaeromonas toyohensis ToBE TaxID=698762 RepID=A0A1W1VY99_9FIRM|nr:3-phosphoshikimate 1-carboxyvinyltransferase [Thermanaeromonas toyohensis]SMB98328.1 3-phosphoshikimate 1-carboxyvinyltransferase [Thermanaeromonas toyohensis ToBE]